MRQKIVINSTPYETRVALLENETLVEIHIERTQQRNIAGNIYLGKVTRILPGMQAAFVDIGLEKAGFIHASDIFGGPLPAGFSEDSDEDQDSPEQNGYYSANGQVELDVQPEQEEPIEPIDLDQLDEFDLPDDPDELAELGEFEASTSPDTPSVDQPKRRPTPSGRGRRRRAEPVIPLEHALKKNQEILVQVAKESIGTKGPRITSHLSLPGRHLVYTPTASHIGVSRRISDLKERKRLRGIVADMKAEGGFIVRTACEGLTKKEIQDDLKFLLKLWHGLSKKREQSTAPALLHEDMDVVLRIIRDLLTPEVDEVIVDTVHDYERLKEFAATFLPRSTSRIKLYKGAEPIFDAYNVESQIAKALERRVYMKSGGHIVVDQTEALTAIDVNTGRFVGKHDQEATMLQTNLEAVKVVVEQLRLRNLGGLIIIDFIDMERAANRTKVTETLRAALKKDKTRSNMRKISELGLVQMTRKRTRESLKQQLCDPCPYCDGKGVIRSVTTISYNILRELHKAASLHPTAATLLIKAHPEVITFLYDEESEQLDALERSLRKRFFLRATPTMHIEEFEVSAVGPEPAHPPAPRQTKRKSSRTPPKTEQPSAETQPASKPRGRRTPSPPRRTRSRATPA